MGDGALPNEFHINVHVHYEETIMKKIILLGSIVFAMVMAMSSTASSQPPPKADTCRCVNGQKCVDIWDPATQTYVPGGCGPDATCEGQFETTDGTPIEDPDQGPINEELTPTSISGSATIPTLGRLEIQLDETRTPDPTTVKSNDPNPPAGGNGFPLSVNINFYATATADAAAGATVYESVQQLSYSTTNANSFTPFEHVTVTLDNDVEFIVKGDPERRVVFKLNAGQNTLTLGE